MQLAGQDPQVGLQGAECFGSGFRPCPPGQLGLAPPALTPRVGRPYDLRHAAVSTWLNAGVPAAQVAEWAGHSVDVLLRVYVKCIAGQQGEAKRRIEDAMRPPEDDEPGSTGQAQSPDNPDKQEDDAP
jgi:hypothetical protein